MNIIYYVTVVAMSNAIMLLESSRTWFQEVEKLRRSVAVQAFLNLNCQSFRYLCSSGNLDTCLKIMVFST